MTHKQGFPASSIVLLFLVGMTSITTTVSATTSIKYVTDKITLEIHQTSSSRSSLIEQVPSGTPLTILDTDGAYTKVETPDEKVGWVEAAYLMTEKPAKMLYKELAVKHNKSLALIVDLKQNNPAPKQSEKEKQSIIWMRAELKKAREKIKNMSITLANRNLNSKATTQDKATMKTRIDNLEKRLADKVQENNDNINELNNFASKTTPDDAFFEGTDKGIFYTAIPLMWFLIGLAVFMILGGLAGASMLDAHNRKRHGGFRV